MRIVSGQYRGRTINPPKNFNARPTTDFAKEALFNILAVNFDFEDLTVLDLFSGTGGISFEFASRGCRAVDSVEMSFAHHAFIKKTAQELKFSQMRCYKQNAFSFITSCPNTYDIIFADPPYDLEGIEKIHETVFERQMLKPEGWLILEHSKGKDLSVLKHFKEHRNYGSVNFSIFTEENS